MHVVVVGCGRVGSRLAQVLLDQGHTVAVVDRRADAFSRLGTDFGGATVEGIGFDRDRLREAGAEGAGALAAVTNGDNTNVVVARVARETFDIANVVARIYDPRRAAIYQRLGLATVATVAWTTDQVLRRLVPGSTPAEWTDPTASICVVERALPDVWAGHPLVDLEERAAGARVVGVARFATALVPSATTVAQQGDVLYLTVTADGVDTLDRALAAGPGTART